MPQRPQKVKEKTLMVQNIQPLEYAQQFYLGLNGGEHEELMMASIP